MTSFGGGQRNVGRHLGGGGSEKCVTSFRGGGGQRFVTVCDRGGGGSKIAKNSVTSFMDGPYSVSDI